jgi:hypothetical protein
MSEVHVELLAELRIEGKPLGRHIEHDPRSRDYAYEPDLATTDFKTVLHHRYGGVFDQGEVGSCTGNACAGAINTVPLRDKAIEAHSLKEADAVDLYELATHLDNIPGFYPEEDTGSTGLAVAKAAKQKGYITSYKHAFSVDAALAALQKRPIIIGIAWYEGYDNPDPTGLIKQAGQIRGGHEIELRGFQLASDLLDSLIIAENSWSSSWGLNGLFNFTVATFQQMMDQQGDATIMFRS